LIQKQFEHLVACNQIFMDCGAGLDGLDTVGRETIDTGKSVVLKRALFYGDVLRARLLLEGHQAEGEEPGSAVQTGYIEKQHEMRRVFQDVSGKCVMEGNIHV
jgi:hypothetical protein